MSVYPSITIKTLGPHITTVPFRSREKAFQAMRKLAMLATQNERWIEVLSDFDDGIAYEFNSAMIISVSCDIGTEASVQ